MRDSLKHDFVDSKLRQGTAFMLYDGDCGPCTRFKNIVKRIDITNRIIPVKLQDEFALSLLKDMMSREQMMRSFHVACPKESGDENLQIFSAGDGLIRLIELLPIGTLAMRLIRRSRESMRLIRWFYSQMTRLRNASGSCGL